MIWIDHFSHSSFILQSSVEYTLHQFLKPAQLNPLGWGEVSKMGSLFSCMTTAGEIEMSNSPSISRLQLSAHKISIWMRKKPRPLFCLWLPQLMVCEDKDHTQSGLSNCQLPVPSEAQKSLPSFCSLCWSLLWKWPAIPLMPKHNHWSFIAIDGSVMNMNHQVEDLWNKWQTKSNFLTRERICRKTIIYKRKRTLKLTQID